MVQIGKRQKGVVEQPGYCPSFEVNGCRQSSITACKKCKERCKSSIEVNVCPRDSINACDKLINEVSDCSQSSLNDSNGCMKHGKLRLDNQVNCYPRILVNECEVHCMSRLDTVTVGVDQGKTEKLRFLIDTGAEISIIRGTSLKPGINFEPTNGINVKGIFDALSRTEGTVLLHCLL